MTSLDAGRESRLRIWVAGARPRTLPAAVAPVVAGTATAAYAGGFAAELAILALVVSLALQVGVNYANDYSDGIRGADANRVGPMRLVGSGAAAPRAVLRAAVGCFGLAAVAGLGVVLLTGYWWLLAVGALAIVAAWGYTGGSRPYGYLGLGELFVFVFFGLVAVCGTGYIQLGRITSAMWFAAVGIGALATSILVANNLRDRTGDLAVGKRTLATRLGDAGTRRCFIGLLVVALACVVGVAASSSWWAMLGWASLPLLIGAARPVLRGAQGPALIVVLGRCGAAELVTALGLAAGLGLATYL